MYRTWRIASKVGRRVAGCAQHSSSSSSRHCDGQSRAIGSGGSRSLCRGETCAVAAASERISSYTAIVVVQSLSVRRLSSASSALPEP